MTQNSSTETLDIRPCSVCPGGCACPDGDGLYPLTRMSGPSASVAIVASQQSLHLPAPLRAIRVQTLRACRSVTSATTIVEAKDLHAASAVDVQEEDDEKKAESYTTLIGCGDANGDENPDDNDNDNDKNQAPVLVTLPMEPAQGQKQGASIGAQRAWTAVRRIVQWLRRRRLGNMSA